MELKTNRLIYAKAHSLYQKHSLAVIDCFNKDEKDNSISSYKHNILRNKRMDIFTRSSFSEKLDKVEAYSIYGNWESKRIKGEPTEEMYDAVNFGSEHLKLLCIDEGDNFIYEYKGKVFSTQQFKPIPLNRCKEIKAVNNVLKFEEGNYYKYTRNGETHVIACLPGGSIRSPESDSAALKPYSEYEKADKTAELWDCLFNLFEGSGVERKRLDGVGIKPGFFTVEKPGAKIEIFYSKGKYNCQVPKVQYDAKFNSFVRGNLLSDLNPGDILKIGGKEYVLNEHNGVDIPYGADIYDVEYPKVRCAKNT